MKELLTIYRAALRGMCGKFMRLQPRNIKDNVDGRSTVVDAAHLLWMLDQMDAMLDRMDAMPLCVEQAHVITKFHRWLGFVQGWLWHQKVFSVDELRDQTRVALEC